LQQTSQESTRRSSRHGLANLVKRKVLLLTNYAHDLAHHGASKARKSDRNQDTFDVLSLELSDIDLAIVDLGANFQSLTIIEGLTHSEPAPRVIALVDGTDAEAIREFHRRGAAASLEKPFCADELARLIEVVCASTSHQTGPSCEKRRRIGRSSARKSEPAPTTRRR